ncbi:7823_t:CDS:1, partial [Funneliformis caledonium]
DRLTLRTIFLRGKKDYADEKELSVIFPLSWEFCFQFLEVFELMENVIQYILKYPNVIKELIKYLTKSSKFSEFSIRHCISCITDQI